MRIVKLAAAPQEEGRRQGRGTGKLVYDRAAGEIDRVQSAGPRMPPPQTACANGQYTISDHSPMKTR